MPRRNARSPKLYLLGAALTALTVYVLDQATKAFVERTMQLGESISVLGDWLRWHYILNPGAAFSLGENYTWLFTAIMAVVSVGILIYLPRVRSWPWVLGLGMVLGGALGNLTDRLFRWPGFPNGHVVDFIHVQHFAVFNIADCGVVVGIALIALLLLTGREADGTRYSPKKKHPDAESTQA
ncbi:signal peptidase II [Kocuria sp.]|uniref:signal peptidase II n=1 Tax=Kocuria sp. TaxID=1871328 RepID=UPI0026E03246|nr:signal peptidase II [Kocuria sp.]MDO5618442.1 signal peptidase II [Kocuria sp.]